MNETKILKILLILSEKGERKRAISQAQQQADQKAGPVHQQAEGSDVPREVVRRVTR
jgi:hypothetical protein